MRALPRLTREQTIRFLQSHGAVVHKKEPNGIVWYRTDSGMFVRVRALVTGEYEVGVFSSCECNSK